MATTSIDVTTVNGSTGVEVINSEGSLGDVVANIGDINNDGLDDIAIGNPQVGEGGQIFVVFGVDDDTVSTIDVSELDGTNGFELIGGTPDMFAGWAISGVGDFNNDGVDDFVIGAPNASPNGKEQAGRSYLVFGRADGNFAPVTGDASTLSLTTTLFENSGALVFDGVQGETDETLPDFSGFSVSGAGDVNNDGFDDFIIGAFQSAGITFSQVSENSPGGRSYVIFGTDTYDPGILAEIDLSWLDGTDGVEFVGPVRGSSAGAFVSGAGDVDGDGIDDIIIGAPQAGYGFVTGGPVPVPTYNYVVPGSEGSFPASVTLSVPGATDPGNAVFTGNQTAGQLGIGVSNIGDVNGDGIDDVATGTAIEPLGPGPGVDGVYGTSVVFGVDGGLPDVTNLTTLDGAAGFNFDNGANEQFNAFLAPAGDFNNDGIDDFLISRSEGGGIDGNTGLGFVYLVFGSTDGFPDILEPSQLDGTNGITLQNGQGEGQNLGFTVDGGGDFNGDGLPDIIIPQSANANRGGVDTVYVVYGSESVASDIGLLFQGTGADDAFLGDDGDDDAFGRGGSDILRGGGGADALFGEEGSDVLAGGEGADQLSGGPGLDVLFSDDGNDTFMGTAADFDGDVIRQFGRGDEIRITDLGDAPMVTAVNPSEAQVTFDTDGDGTFDGSLTVVVAAPETAADLQVSTDGDETVIGFDPNAAPGEAPVLDLSTLGANVAQDFANGIAGQSFLDGDGGRDFLVSIVEDERFFAAYDNVLGVYQIDGDGTISNVEILFDNVKEADAPVEISDVAEGHTLGFFMIRDGASLFDDDPSEDVFAFVNAAGETGAITDQSDLTLMRGGEAIAADIFHTFDAALNADGETHALSGVDGFVMTIGMEDLVGLGDSDYEDLVFTVEILT